MPRWDIFYCGGVETNDGIRYPIYRVFTGNFYEKYVILP